MNQQADQRTCLWCSTVFRPRASGGTRQRFCSRRCRGEFHDCARRWATAEVDAGRLTPTQLAKAAKRSINAVVASGPAQTGGSVPDEKKPSSHGRENGSL